MGILRLQIFVILLFACVWTHARDSYQPKSTPQSIQQVLKTLESSGINFSQDGISRAEESFRAKSASHRLRLSEIFLDVSSDPKFTDNFPEFKPLLENKQETVKMLLKHDAAKVAEGTKDAIKTLSLLQGYSLRNRNESLNPEADKKIKEALKNAIDDINASDKKIMAEALDTIKDPKARKLHEALAEVLDYYDTSKMRQNELAKDGDKLKSTLEWLEEMEASGRGGTPEEMALKKKFAELLDTKDPLKDTSKFTTESHFKGQSTRQIDDEFVQRSQNLEKRAQTLSKSATISVAEAAPKSVGAAKNLATGTAELGTQAAKAIAKGAAGAALVSGAAYVISPESVSGSDAVNGTGFAYSKHAGFCDESLECQKFAKFCAEHMNIEYNGNPGQVFSKFPSFELDDNPNVLKRKIKVKDLGFEKCANYFYNLPLETQSKMRQDGDLDKLFGKYTPNVRSLTCKKEADRSLIITTTTVQPSAVLEGQSDAYIDQQIHYDNLGNLTKLTRGDDVVFYHNMEPSTYQRCTRDSNCKSTVIKEIREKKQYFWRKDELEPYRWVLNNEKLIKKQSDALKACCDSKSCLDYFANARKVETKRPEEPDVKHPGNANNPGGKIQGSR
jgi:hypothetical protein